MLIDGDTENLAKFPRAPTWSRTGDVPITESLSLSFLSLM